MMKRTRTVRPPGRRHASATRRPRPSTCCGRGTCYRDKRRSNRSKATPAVLGARAAALLTEADRAKVGRCCIGEVLTAASFAALGAIVGFAFGPDPAPQRPSIAHGTPVVSIPIVEPDPHGPDGLPAAPSEGAQTSGVRFQNPSPGR
jgi:uncharacterized membrane protein YebE (DUF533 family)